MSLSRASESTGSKRKASALEESSGNSAPNTPKKPKSKVKATKSDDLAVFQLDTKILSSTVAEWISGDKAGTGSNQSLPGRLDVVGKENLKFQVPEVDTFGPCWSFSSRTKKGKNSAIETTLKLVEGGTNNDSPRWTHSNRKYYIYHMLALYAATEVEAAAARSALIIGDVDEEAASARLHLPANLKFTVADLLSVSPSKTGVRAKTILHLCGNKWCCWPGHYFVGSKIFNDEQTACHKGLHNARTLEEYLEIQNSYCKHEPRCWALPYSGEYDLTPGFCETGLAPSLPGGFVLNEEDFDEDSEILNDI